MEYQPYEEYFECKLDWLDEMPKGWDVIPIKFGLEIPIADGPHETPEILIEGIPFLSAEAVKKDKLDFSRKRGFITIEEHERFSKKYKPKKGDVYMVKSGATTGNVARVETDEEFNIWSPLAALRPLKGMTITDFIFYFMKSKPFFHSVELSWSYGTQQNIGMGVISNLQMALPSVEEQQKIATFLDYKTQQIDQLIEKKKVLIDKLNEQRVAVITQAVTKGLDKQIKMKSSGVKWLGDVPENWLNRYKLAFLSESKKQTFVNGPFGSDLLTSELKDEGVPVIYSGDVKESGFNRKSKKHVTEEKAAQLDFCRIDSGDVLLAKVGDPPGDACVYPVGENAIATQDVVRIKVDKEVVDPEYLCYLLNSKIGRYIVKQVSVEATRGRFSLADLKRIRFTIPPIAEQKYIVQLVNKRLDVKDRISKKIKEAIDKLEEYRSALITSAVTGKIDVRNVNLPNQDGA